MNAHPVPTLLMGFGAIALAGDRAAAGGPNILYLLADDLSYGDLRHLNPGGKIPTPNIDRLARAGMTFTDAHSASSVCTPTRYGILTGRYNWRSRLKSGVLGGYETRHGRNLARRFEAHGESYFRFITEPGVAPTNNLAEQAIRFVVIDRRITQGTRSEAGKRWCERIWTVIATCTQPGRPVFTYLEAAVGAWFEGTRRRRCYRELRCRRARGAGGVFRCKVRWDRDVLKAPSTTGAWAQAARSGEQPSFAVRNTNGRSLADGLARAQTSGQQLLLHR